MLETIREYALEQLHDLSTADELRHEHANYFFDFALTAERELQGESQAEWLDRLDRDRTNLNAALTWSREYDTDLQIRLVNALVRFWVLRGQLRTGQAWVEEALTRNDADARRRNVTLRWATYFAAMLGQHARTETLIREWLGSARALGDLRSVGEALFRLGELQVETGEIEAGRGTIEDGLRISRELNDAELTAKLLGVLGVAAREEGDHVAAAGYLEEAAALDRSAGSRFNLGISLQKLAMARIDSGQLNDAAAPLRESLAIFCDYKNEFEIGFLLEAVATLIAAEDAEAVVRLLGKAEALRAPSNARLERAELHRVVKLRKSIEPRMDATQWERAWTEGERRSTMRSRSHWNGCQKRPRPESDPGRGSNGRCVTGVTRSRSGCRDRSGVRSVRSRCPCRWR
jgi:non-specific serine/threonine protein kinase